MKKRSENFPFNLCVFKFSQAEKKIVCVFVVTESLLRPKRQRCTLQISVIQTQLNIFLFFYLTPWVSLDFDPFL